MPTRKEKSDMEFINIALPKGRLGEKVLAMFESAGFECPSIHEENRKLIFENAEVGVRYFWVKPSDVAIYVERGAADIGVAGKDILLEYEPDVYELLDLGLGKCRMAVAAKKDFRDNTDTTLRVATKFPNIAEHYYAEKCRDIDIIHLNGSIEIAPILGLSDVIVDIVETGKTLYENDLEPKEDVVKISARFIANKSSYQFKHEVIEKIKCSLAEIVKARA
jgi:ATP phosphoribosyltransferase